MKTYYFFSHTAWILPLSFFYLLFTGVSWASDDNEWIPLSRTEDTPEILGENLANKLVLKFKKEGTNVIFLALPKCVPGPIVSDEWCDNFYSELMTKLSAKNIRFLKENEQKSIREKIANEQAYQQGSLQVDVSKAVSLGKQNAFQAYVSIEVIGSSADKIRTTANSINIEQGAVTITEKAAITIKLENMRSTGTLFFGLTTSIFGFGVGGYGLIEAAKH